MKKNNGSDDLKAEYDFASMRGGIRGKYAKRYRAGTNIAVLADDVASAFPTDDAVNRALRAIMDAAESVPRRNVLSKKVPQRRGTKRQK